MHSNDMIKVYFRLKSIFSERSREISKGHRQITTIWQSLPILRKVLISIPCIIMIPFLFALSFFPLLALVFVILAFFLIYRWISLFITDSFKAGNMKVPTFYSIKTTESEQWLAFVLCWSLVGVVFGGIHCTGWYFNFPSSDEATLWRVSSAVLTSIAFLIPIFFFIVGVSLDSIQSEVWMWPVGITTLLAIIAYVVSRLLLLVEAFISLRHLTVGMLALVK